MHAAFSSSAPRRRCVRTLALGTILPVRSAGRYQSGSTGSLPAMVKALWTGEQSLQTELVVLSGRGVGRRLGIAGHESSLPAVGLWCTVEYISAGRAGRSGTWSTGGRFCQIRGRRRVFLVGVGYGTGQSTQECRLSDTPGKTHRRLSRSSPADGVIPVAWATKASRRDVPGFLPPSRPVSPVSRRTGRPTSGNARMYTKATEDTAVPVILPTAFITTGDWFCDQRSGNPGRSEQRRAGGLGRRDAGSGRPGSPG